MRQSLSRVIAVAAISVAAAAGIGVTPATAGQNGSRDAAAADPVDKLADGTAVVAAVATKLPEVDGPTYNFTSGSNNVLATDGITPQVDSLPFNYTFLYEADMESRRFKTTTGKVCNWADVYSSQDIRIQLWIDVFGADVQVVPTVWYPASGGSHYYCWTGLNTTNTYYLHFLDGWAEGAGTVNDA